MAGGGNAEGEFGFQIAPMLDILFVLLLFFMVSAGAQKHEANLSTRLPGQGGPGVTVPLEVGVDEDGQVSVSGTPIDDPADHNLPQLVERLKQVMTANADQPIVVTPTRTSKHQRVIDVLNACAAAHVKNLAFGTPQD